MSHHFVVLLSLALGVFAALGVSAWFPGLKAGAVSVAEVGGALWVNALRMTVIPLVVSLVITSIAGSDRTFLSRIGKRAAPVFAAMLLLGSVAAALIAAVSLPWLPGSAGALSQMFGSDEVSAPLGAAETSLSGWLVSLVPANPLKAAADGAVLPLMVVSVLFAVALHRVRQEHRAALLSLFRAVAEAVFVVLGWVIWLAPAGVFCLTFALVAKAGVSVVTALGFYVALLSGTSVAMMAALFGAVFLLRTVPWGAFVRAVGPALVIAFTSRSSMAALPVLMGSAKKSLPEHEQAIGVVLPLAASVLRLSAPVSLIVAAMFVSEALGIGLGTGQLITLVAMAMLFSFTVPGIPNASFISMVPVFETLGLPTQAVGVLLGVDVIPDAFRTMLNVTGHLTAATLTCDRQSSRQSPSSEAQSVGSHLPGR
ncbi:MAG: dicarboxylate/amino acid:cation symporter [Bryobacteraceae bacterium]